MSKKSDRREKLVKFSNIAAVYALLSFEHELFVIVKKTSQNQLRKVQSFLINGYGTLRSK